MLTAADHQHMEEQGYVIVPNAVAPEELAAVVDGIWSHLWMDRNDPNSWYEDPKGDNLQQYGFMRQMHTPAMWRVRQSPQIHRAFADLWGTTTCRSPWTAVSSSRPCEPTGPNGARQATHAACCTSTSR
ncbi:MAG: hypothetical protein OSB73_24080 [Candidatus Latescibacteria bacterium]|nr:hypothetical protein [Candidatus Latescibacterota bacterium]